jgi:hypothetical protein
VADVYSTQLIAAQGIGFVPVLVFTAPPGYRTVFTTISAVTGVNAPDTYWALTHGPSGAKIAGASHLDGTTDWTNDLLAGRWVLNEGETLTFASDGSAWDLFCSGFLLVLP